MMLEPYRSEFRELVREGAGARDIYGAAQPAWSAGDASASDGFLARELARVEQHGKSLCSVLERYLGRSPRILDVGCGTGGSTVALALAPTLAPDQVVGVDPNAGSCVAANVRARAHGLNPPRVSFIPVAPGAPLPFADATFDLAVCVSVLECVSQAEVRCALVAEMRRVTRPGGYIYLSTPNPLRLREYHTGRWLGDHLRRDGYPWATSPWALRSMLNGCEEVPVGDFFIERAFARLGHRPPPLPRVIARWLPLAARWQKMLVRMPTSPT